MTLRRMIMAATLLGLATASTAFAASPSIPSAPAGMGPSSMAPSTMAKQATPDPACMVKGNLNAKGAKIYYDSTDKAYGRMKVDTTKGGRCFKSVDDAKSAGFRPARHA
jgi:micrococcal nuclease